MYCTLTLRPPIWENDINLWVTKFIVHCKIKGPESRTIKATVTTVNIVFCQSPFTQDRIRVQKGMFSFDIAFTWFSCNLKQLIHWQINQEYIYTTVKLGYSTGPSLSSCEHVQRHSILNYRFFSHLDLFFI